MKIKITEQRQAITIERSPITVEKGRAHLSFSLPVGEFSAVYGYRGNQYYEPIVEGVAKIPSHLLTESKYVQLSVIETAEDSIVSIKCEPLRVIRLSDSLSRQFEIYGAFSEEDAKQQLAKLAEDVERIDEKIAQFNGRMEGYEKELKELREELAKAVETIAQSAQRIYALENDNDPLKG